MSYSEILQVSGLPSLERSVFYSAYFIPEPSHPAAKQTPKASIIEKLCHRPRRVPPEFLQNFVSIRIVFKIEPNIKYSWRVRMVLTHVFQQYGLNRFHCYLSFILSLLYPCSLYVCRPMCTSCKIS